MTATAWRAAPGWGVVDRPGEGDLGGRLYAAPLATGPVTVLDGPSAVVARAALAGRSLPEIRTSLVAALDVPPEDVDDIAVADLLGDLTRLGLLQPAGA